MTSRKLVGWIGAAVVLVGLSVPWFLWGDRTTAVGVPLWVWWHVAWLLLAAVVFRLFATRAWGLGIERKSARGGASGDPTGNGDDQRGEAR